MLEILANLAQVLGFSLQAADFLRRRKDPSENDAVIFSLLALTSNAKSWKSLHARYHPLGIQIHSVVNELSEQRSGRRVPRDIQSIAPNSIRELFFDGMLNDAVAHFRQNTRKDVKIVEASFNPGDPKLASALDSIRVFDATLASEFEEIAECRQQFLDLHERFVNYLSNLSRFISSPSWTVAEVKYVLDNRNILALDLPHMIYTTDKVLMTFLDVYMRVVSQHAAASQFGPRAGRSV